VQRPHSDRPKPTAHDPRDQLRLLVEAQTDYAIFLLDPEGRISSWNPGAQRIKGYTADEIIGRHFSCFYTDADIARAYPEAELEAARRDGRYLDEGWRLRKDGSRFWAQVVITALRCERGELVGFGKVTRDLTERREAEQQLARSERQARREAESMRRRAAALEEMGRAIVASSDLEQMVQLATDAGRELTGAAFGAFFYNVPDDRGEPYTLYTISGVAREAFSRFPMPRATDIFSATFTGAAILRSDDITKDPRYGHMAPYHGMPDGHLPVRSYLAVPVRTTDGEVAGGLFFGHPDVAVFDVDAEEAAVSIAASAAVALVNRRLLDAAQRDAEARRVALDDRDRVARVLQMSLLPPALPDLPGLEVGSHYQPGRELVGGDFYDVFPLADEHWGIVLGDVCGIGPEAAARTTLTRYTVRNAAVFHHDPARVLDALNTELVRSDSDRFITAVFARVEPAGADGSVPVRLASGGHPPSILCRADGTVAECAVQGSLLGVTDCPRLTTTALTLQPGDALILYTDGLVEARRDGEVFGAARLLEAVGRLSRKPPQELAGALVDAAREFAGTQLSDDIAIVVIRVRSTGSEAEELIA
jgi:PAS domain S-box-containing protein